MREKFNIQYIINPICSFRRTLQYILGQTHFDKTIYICMDIHDSFEYLPSYIDTFIVKKKKLPDVKIY